MLESKELTKKFGAKTALPVFPETKQHPVPLSANIPDKAYEAVLPCRVISL